MPPEGAAVSVLEEAPPPSDALAAAAGRLVASRRWT